MSRCACRLLPISIGLAEPAFCAFYLGIAFQSRETLRSTRTLMTTQHTMEWLFDGVGGAALLALVGFAYHKFRARRDTQPTQSTTPESRGVVAEDKSVAVGHRSNVQASPVVYGSHNTINIAHHPHDGRAETLKKTRQEAKKKRQGVSISRRNLSDFGVAAMFMYRCDHLGRSPPGDHS
jgi:hypothetical protein